MVTVLSSRETNFEKILHCIYIDTWQSLDSTVAALLVYVFSPFLKFLHWICKGFFSFISLLSFSLLSFSRCYQILAHRSLPWGFLRKRSKRLEKRDLFLCSPNSNYMIPISFIKLGFINIIEESHFVLIRSLCVLIWGKIVGKIQIRYVSVPRFWRFRIIS